MLRNFLRTSRWLAQRKINRATGAAISRPVLKTPLILPVCRLPHSQSYSNTTTTIPPEHIDPAVFDEICKETLESLCEYFEEIVDDAPNLKGADITFSDGVLTVSLGPKYGTYVINRQTPNKQIWLSSPTSGPKRYDLISDNGGHWVYKHDGVSLHQLLQNEISQIVKDVDFKRCAHSLV